MIKRINTDKLQRFCELNKLGIKDQEYFKLREELMVLYMPMARRIVESQNIKNIDIDDLYQMAYEALILCLDGLTNYKEFGAYLRLKINFHISKYKSDYEPVASPISEVEIQSNLDVDEYVVNKVHTEQLYKIFNEKLKKYNKGNYHERDIEIFRKHHGTVDEPMTEKALAKMFKISATRVHQNLVYVCSQTRRRLYNANVDVDRIYEEYDTAREYNDIEHEHSYTKIKK